MYHVDRNSGILNAEEALSSDERRRYQEKFLREVIAHAYASGTPLKASMDGKRIKPDDVRTAQDLQKIPITKKKDLSDAQKTNPPFGGYLTVPISDLVRIHQSPGPIYDPVGKVHDYWRWKTALYSVGLRPGDLAVNTFAYHLTPAGHMFEEGVSELGGTVIPTGVGNTETQVEIIKNLGVTGYIGTPSFLMAILKKAEDVGIDPAADLKLEVAFLLAEMLPESMRKRFVDEYHIVGRQAYGTADVGGVAYECPQISGMHIHYDVIVEIVNPETGEPMPNGEPGEVVVTCNNRIYPLVRFGTGDLSSLTEEPCPCGRTGPRLTRILGRVDQLTKVKGMFVHPSQVQKVIDAHPEISKGRLLVERPKDQDIMTLEVELKGPVAEGFASVLEQTLRETAKLRGAVRILEPGTLPADHKTIEDVRKWD
jgi:phenylacetate-CoA ligase